MITAVINFLTSFIMPCDTDNVILKCYNQTYKGKKWCSNTANSI